MRELPLTQNKVALVDDDLYPALSQYKWSVDGSGYPQRSIDTAKGRRPTRMHRDVLALRGIPKTGVPDHVNRDKLDNRTENLRYCTATENSRNRALNGNNATGYKGVNYYAKRGWYRAHITVDRQHLFLGSFKTAEEAAYAYDQAAIKHFGEFAFLNGVAVAPAKTSMRHKLCKYRGVSRSKYQWRARLKKDGVTLELGTFTTPEEAARAYDQAAIKAFGEFAYINGV